MSQIMGPTDAPASGFSKVQHAYAVLRGEILDGVLQPGEWLRLSPIAERLRLSEMPVREAVRLLQRDGLVNIHLHRGAQVAALSFERALEITQVRMSLECLAAIDATPHHDEGSVRELRRSLERLRDGADDLIEFAVGNRAFANQIYARCANTFLREHIQYLWNQVWQYSSTAVFEVMRHRVDDTLRENEEIVQAVAEKRVAVVEAIYADRLQRSMKAWKRAIVERGVAR